MPFSPFVPFIRTNFDRSPIHRTRQVTTGEAGEGISKNQLFLNCHRINSYTECRGFLIKKNITKIPHKLTIDNLLQVYEHFDYK